MGEQFRSIKQGCGMGEQFRSMPHVYQWELTLHGLDSNTNIINKSKLCSL